MIDINLATAVRNSWISATRCLNGEITINTSKLRKELRRHKIGYYRLREYLEFYLSAVHKKDIERTLEIIYFPQSATLRDNDETIPINLIKVKEMENCKTIRIINKSDNPLPEYKTEGSSGMDLRAYISQDEVDDEFCEREFNLIPFERRLVHTGLYVELPKGTELQIRSRSGLANDYGVVVLNAPGTVDCDYRGEICVNLINLSQNVFTIRSGERIAQAVLASYIRAEFEEVEVLSETERAEGGHGSTGLL